MTDKEYNNRLIVPDDYASQYPEQSSIVAPQVDIYDGDLVYFACNREWRPIITGWLSWLTESTYWDSADSEKSSGQEGISTFLEGVNLEDISMPLTDADKVIICDGVESGLLKYHARAQVGSSDNVSGSVTINPDGTVTVNSGSGSTPTTQSGQRLRMGAMEYVQEQLKKFLDDYETFYLIAGASNQSVILDFFNAKYQLNNDLTTTQNAISTSVSMYVTHRDTDGNPAPDTSLGTLARDFFCKTASASVASSWIITNSSTYKSLLVNMIEPLLQSQFDAWFSESLDAISDDYLNTACYRNPPVSLTLTPDGWSQLVNPTRSYKSVATTLLPNRQYLVTSTGSFTDGVNSWNGFYTDDGTDETYHPLGFDDDNNFTGAVYPATQPVGEDYTTEGVIYNLIVATTFAHVTRGKFDGWTGQIDLTFEDRGALS